jgi:hypothetical protein
LVLPAFHFFIDTRVKRNKPFKEISDGTCKNFHIVCF